MAGYRRNSSVCSTITRLEPCFGSARWVTSPSVLASVQMSASSLNRTIEAMSGSGSPPSTATRSQNRRSGVQRVVIGMFRQRSSPSVWWLAPTSSASTNVGFVCTASTRSSGTSPAPGSSQSGARSLRNFHSGMSSSGATSGSASNGGRSPVIVPITRSTTTGRSTVGSTPAAIEPANAPRSASGAHVSIGGGSRRPTMRSMAACSSSSAAAASRATCSSPSAASTLNARLRAALVSSCSAAGSPSTSIARASSSEIRCGGGHTLAAAISPPSAVDPGAADLRQRSPPAQHPARRAAEQGARQRRRAPVDRRRGRCRRGRSASDPSAATASPVGPTARPAPAAATGCAPHRDRCAR